jgi:hypothetical protein
MARGTGELLQPAPMSPEEQTARNIVAVRWSDGTPAFDLAAVNLSPDRSRCRLMLPEARPKTKRYRVHDWLNDSARVKRIDLDASRSILLELPGFAAPLLHYEPEL